jgi:hypothetical protein
MVSVTLTGLRFGFACWHLLQQFNGNKKKPRYCRALRFVEN